MSGHRITEILKGLEAKDEKRIRWAERHERKELSSKKPKNEASRMDVEEWYKNQEQQHDPFRTSSPSNGNNGYRR